MLKLNISKVNDNNNITSDLRRHTCEDENECDRAFSNQCAQTCINLKGSYKCECAAQYWDPHGDGAICEAAYKEDSVVLVAYGAEIRQLRPNASDFSYTTLIENENFVASMDVDPLERVVYWIDEPNAQIKRSYIPEARSAQGSKQIVGSVEKLLGMSTEENGMYLTALAVDWLGRNLYFAEALNRTIRVAKLDGRYAQVIVQGADYVDQVYSMAVNPVLGVLYWIDKGSKHRIMAASMNGENVRVLVDSGLDAPTGLAIDYFKVEIFAD